MGGFSIWHWLIFLAIILVLFGGGKRLRNLGEDLSAGIKSFRKGMQDSDASPQLKADPNSTTTNAEKSERVDSK